MKKIVLVFLLSTSIFGIFSCNPCGEYLSYKEIISVNSTLVSMDRTERIDTETDIDSLIVWVDLKVDFLASRTPISFINTAYALSCPDHGELGLKDKMVDIKFHSTVEYLGIPVGAPIDLDNSENWTKAELINYLNQSEEQFKLLLVEKQVGFFDLHVTFDYESGTSETFELASFQWE